MPDPQTQPLPNETPAAVFDELGNPIDAALADDLQPVDPNAAVPEEPTDDPNAPAEGPHKYRIGERTFATQDEALAYASSTVVALETEAQVADAYRRGIQDAATFTPGAPGVTPAPAPQPPEFNADEYYGDPQGFLDKYAKRIKTETIQTIQSQQTQAQQSDAVWNQFAVRHAGLSDFRREVEAYVEQNREAVRAVFATKGDGAGFDYIAMKLRSQFARYAEATKPQRQLPNGGGGASPRQPNARVTPAPAPKKPLSFAEQIRSIKRKR